MISVIIPTRNRPELLLRLVNILIEALNNESEIIIVDSSDCDKSFPERYSDTRIRYHKTDIRSAAIQRNIGLELRGNKNYTFFLDDDVVPSRDYFAKCISALVETKSIGVSGIAVNSQKSTSRSIPKGLSGLFHRIFLLDSNRDGVLLSSGINIPVRGKSRNRIKTEWLIGCSGWVSSVIDKTRFESDFQGQSLAEDVIFSVRMRKFGELVTDSSIHLEHEESAIERPSGHEFWKMWVVNRFRLVKVLKGRRKIHYQYWWANTGQLVILFYTKTLKKDYIKGSISGFMDGLIVVLRAEI